MNERELYKWLSNPQNLKPFNWEKQRQNDGMSVIALSIGGWWKPIYLLDDRNKTAVQFMNMDEHLLTVTANDIDWSSVTEDLDGFHRAKSLYAGFPTNFRGFKNDVALLEWQINPDGRYYMDDDGYGMSDDDEVTLFGFVGRDGRVVEPFRYLADNYDRLDQMRTAAEKQYKHLHQPQRPHTLLSLWLLNKLRKK